MTRSIKSFSIKLMQLLLTALILVWLFHHINFDINAVFGGIVKYHFLFVAICLPLIVLPIISSNRWKLFLKHVGVEEKAVTLIKISLVSLFQGLILPSSQGQDVMRIIHIEKRHPDQRGKVGSTILIERLVGFVILCVLSLIFSFFADIPNRNKVLYIIGGIFILLVIVIMLLLDKRLNAFLSKKHFTNRIINSCYQYINKFATSLAYFPYKRVLLSSTVLILIFQLLTILSVSLVFKAYGINIPFATHVSLYPIISILSMIPITISGFGIRESFFVYFYSQLGVPADVAVSVSLMNYVVLTLLPALLGSILYVIDILKKERIE